MVPIAMVMAIQIYPLRYQNVYTPRFPEELGYVVTWALTARILCFSIERDGSRAPTLHILVGTRRGKEIHGFETLSKCNSYLHFRGQKPLSNCWELAFHHRI